MDITLSLVIPAYNEARRLPPFLASVRTYLEDRYPGRYEVIVVDDGSEDGLSDVLAPAKGSRVESRESRAEERLQRGPACDQIINDQSSIINHQSTIINSSGWPELAVMRHPANCGKGAAVRTGMLAAQGDRLLFADADGATPIDQEGRLSEAIRAGADVAVGSRLAPGAGVVRRRTWPRAVVGRAFASFARLWLRIPVRDTQCGFKMFRREVGHRLFSAGQESGYLFDLELLILAARLGYQVVEVPINWADVPGGHLSLITQLGKVLVGLWRLRRDSSLRSE